MAVGERFDLGLEILSAGGGGRYVVASVGGGCGEGVGGGGVFGGEVLRLVWKKNLTSLRRRVETR